MADLLFFTDRYPYNNSEAFIENEISIMASHFDNIYCLPCGLMVETSTRRAVPQNVHIIEPACADDIFQNKPDVLKKVRWAITNLYPWFVLCLFSSKFYRELLLLIKDVGFSFPRLFRVFRTLAPSIRNKYHFRRKLKKYDIQECYAYSYWIEPTVMFTEDIVPQAKVNKVISRTHRWDLYVEESPINYLAFQKQVISYIDRLYVISEDGINYLKRKYKEYESKMFLSRLGTIDKGINPEKKDDKFRIVSCSNLIPVKRVEYIIDTLSELSKKHKNIEWIHFGSGQFFEPIKRRAEEKLLKVHYVFKGIVPNTQIMKYYQDTHVDLFVNVSSSEGIPVSIMEACSCGIPVIATNVGGTSEIVYDGKNGYLLNKDFTIDEFADCIERMMQSTLEYDAMRKASREIWSELFSCTNNYNNFYATILAH